MKIKTLKKALLPILLCVCFLLTACAKYEPIESTEQDLTVVGHVGEFEVKYEELRFVLLSQKKIMMEKYGEDIFENPETSAHYTEMLREFVYESLTANYVILTLCREVGIEANEEPLLEAVQEKLESTANELGGARRYKKFLAENNMTDSFFRFNLLVDIMQNELYYVYTKDLQLIEVDDDKIYDAIQSEFARTQHIYISKSNGKSYDQNKAIIDSAYAQLTSGADFMTVATTYGEDTELTTDGYYIPKGYMSEAYDKAAFELSVDAFTGVIEDDDGFYIIKRLAIEPMYLMINFDTLKDRYQKYAFLNIIDTEREKLEFVPTEYLAALDILSIK
ncbi:MAG: peptidylprolyl isomerase [Clostridia bacterium]|nr:peptidylprolyl isomerase [Clostridia bacterium]